MTNPPVLRRARLRDPRLALAVILVATFVAYLPVLRTPLWLDDYMYLSASRDLGTGHFVRLVFTPWSYDPAFTFTRDFWRPASFLYFKAAEPIFGGHTLPYHLVNLGVHLAATALVWVLARKLDGRPAVAVVAALVFALYPGSNEAVSWISSFNSAALPIMLGSWIVFLQGTADAGADWRRLGLSAALLALALTFRETAATLLAPLALWYLLVQRRESLREPRTYVVFVPYLVVGGVYYLIRTKLFSEPAANPDVYRFGDKFPDHWWYFLKTAFLPFRDPVLGWRIHAQEAAGVVTLVALPVLLALRRWRYFALLLAFVLSVVPSSAATLGVGQRYLYFSTPVLGLLLGLAVADARVWLEGRDRGALSRFVAAPEILVLVLGLGAYVMWDRNEHWVDIGPERQQAWVDELRAEYPELPHGGTLYCVNVPLELALYDAANLAPVVRWYYPDVRHAAWAPDPAAIPQLGPNDRIFIAGDGQLLGDTRPER